MIENRFREPTNIKIIEGKWTDKMEKVILFSSFLFYAGTRPKQTCA